MNRLDTVLTGGTAGLGLGGALLAQATQSPEVTAGTLMLALIGLVSLAIRGHYGAVSQRLDNARLRAELDIYRRICTKDHRCPFSPTGIPACAAADGIDLPGGPSK